MELQQSTLLNIESRIYAIRGLQVMLDRDLAELYKVETKVFNQAVKRNIQRFPSEFRFQLSNDEDTDLRSQTVTSSHGGRRYLPFVFTEQGVSMLSAILKSDIAIQVSIDIINTFVRMKKFINSNGTLFQRLELLEKKQIKYEIKTDEKFDILFNKIEDKSVKPKQGIFYDGQIFDAYNFISNLIRDAKQSIVLVDNYVDDSVLTIFSKNQNIDITIYTQRISKQLKLDIEKYNKQYKNIKVVKFTSSHDRFMIIDKTEVYHIGASLKDLGKKWFAFSRFSIDGLEILKILNQEKGV